jgi:hypothetical protein
VVISAEAGFFGSVSKRMSRLVRIPHNLPEPRSTTGKPEILRSRVISRISPSVVSGWMVIGLMTMPLS